MKLERVTVDPAINTGKPSIRGQRLPVARVLGLLAAGQSREDILAAFPYIEGADIDAALRFAVCLAEDEAVEIGA